MGVLRSATNLRKITNTYNGGQSLATWNPGNSMFGKLSSDAFASAYPSIRAISSEFMQIMPYAIDANGKQIKASAVDALYHPNKQDSSVSFFEKLSVSTLCHRKTYLLVWRREGKEAKPGGYITPKNIAGYTFLEYPSVTRINGKTIYTLGADSFGEDEVIVIPGGVNGNDLYNGYSPSEAARRWSKLDDYVADYQAGFFENGAIPAGTFVVTANNKKDYEDTVSELQKAHRGAGKNGNVVYTPRPIDQNTGKEAHAQIEWIPFSQSNKDIDFKNLFEQTNKRIDLSFGVSQVVKGVDDASTYATAQVSEAGFSKRAVKPHALRIYTTITHELNRITNGLGYAITFEYDIPAVADAEKVKSETKQIDSKIITDMTAAGYSLDTIVDAFELPQTYKLLKTNNTTAVIDDDKPNVDEGGEVEASPDPKLVDGFQNKAHEHSGGCGCTNPKALADESYEKKINKVARTFMQSQINKAIDDVEKENQPTNEVTGDYTNDDLEKFTTDTLVIVTALLIEKGTIQYEDGIQIIADAGLNTDMLTKFTLSQSEIDNYKVYLTNVGKSYASDTQDAIKTVLDRGNIEGWSAQQIQKELKSLTDLEEYRVVRIGRTETVRGGGNGALFSMEQIQSETGYTIKKVWNTTGGQPCEFCRAMNGKTQSVQSAFIPVGGHIEGEDGGTLINDFTDMEIAHAHPNCSCYLTWEVE